MTALRSILPFGPQSGMGEGPEVGHGHARPRHGGTGLLDIDWQARLWGDQ